MPIKHMVCVLAVLSAVCFWSIGPADATPKDVELTQTRVPTIKLLKFRVVTTGSVTSGPYANVSKDLFRFIVFGIKLQDRDQLSFSLVGPDGRVDLGSPTFTGDNAFVELRRRRSEAGTLGDDPYPYPKRKLRYNPLKARLNFFSGKGIAQATPFLSATPGRTRNVPMDLIVHVRRPGDGDFDFTFSGQFTVRLSMGRRGRLHIYRGRGR